MSTSIVLTFDDGSPSDLRIAELLEKYRLHGTFFVPINNSMNGGISVMTRSQLRQLSKKFEIGAHTLEHVALTKITPDEAKNELRYSKKELENIIGKPVIKFCYPYGYFNKNIMNLVREAGFISARTTSWFHTDRKFDPYSEPTTIHFFRHPVWEHFGHCLKWKNFNGLEYYIHSHCPTSPVSLSEIFLEKAKKEKGIFHLWGHSWLFDREGLWTEFEKVLKLLSANNHDSLNKMLSILFIVLGSLRIEFLLDF